MLHKSILGVEKGAVCWPPSLSIAARAVSLLHQRRDGCRPGYHGAHASKRDFVVGHVKDIARKDPPPGPARSGGRGRGPVYPRTGTAMACILVAAFSTACRDAGAGTPSRSLDMDGPVPGHTTAWRAYDAPDKGWLEGAPARAAGGCLEE